MAFRILPTVAAARADSYQDVESVIGLVTPFLKKRLTDKRRVEAGGVPGPWRRVVFCGRRL